MTRLKIVAALALAGALAAGCQPKSGVQQPDLGQAPATVAPTAITVDITVPPTVTIALGTVPAASPPAASSPNGLSSNNTYVNSAGPKIHSPAYSTNGKAPAGATAQCNDGTYSFSATRSGTCSHHGGVARWLTG
jgi:hypothetical protein